MDSATPESTAPPHSGWAATMFVCKTTRVTTTGYDPRARGDWVMPALTVTIPTAELNGD